jgi:hypothetical protein
MMFSPAGYSLPHSRQCECFTGTIPFQSCQMFSACPDRGGNMQPKTARIQYGYGRDVYQNQRERSLPKKPTATVPGPQWAPMTGPT